MGRKYEMQYNSEYFTVAANDIIKGKQSMTLQTARLIRLFHFYAHLWCHS